MLKLKLLSFSKYVTIHAVLILGMHIFHKIFKYLRIPKIYLITILILKVSKTSKQVSISEKSITNTPFM